MKKSMEIVDLMKKRRTNIFYFQKTTWKIKESIELGDVNKLIYYGIDNRNKKINKIDKSYRYRTES